MIGFFVDFLVPGGFGLIVGWVLLGVVFSAESLILAQDERWRCA